MDSTINLDYITKKTDSFSPADINNLFKSIKKYIKYNTINVNPNYHALLNIKDTFSEKIFNINLEKIMADTNLGR